MAKKKVKEILEETTEPKNIPDYCILGNGKTLKDVAKKYGLDEKKLEKLNGQVYATNQIRLK